MSIEGEVWWTSRFRTVSACSWQPLCSGDYSTGLSTTGGVKTSVRFEGPVPQVVRRRRDDKGPEEEPEGWQGRLCLRVDVRVRPLSPRMRSRLGVSPPWCQ